MQGPADTASALRPTLSPPFPGPREHRRELWPFPIHAASRGAPQAERTFLSPSRETQSAPAARRSNVLEQFLVWARTSLAPAAPRLDDPPAARWGPSSADELLQGLFDTLSDDVALIDEHGVVFAANAAWRAAFAAAGAGDGVGADYLDLCGALSPDLDDEAFRGRVRDLVAGRTQNLSFVYVAGRSDAAWRRQVRIRRVVSRGATILIAIHENAGTRAAATAGAADLLTAQDEERQRIAMELHDSTSQHLVALGLGVARLRRIAGAGAQDVLADMSYSVAEVVREIRVLSFLMRPPGLERQPLEDTTRGFVRGFAVRTGLDARFSAVGRIDDVSPAVQHAAFRIVQEALANAFRHAGARTIEVELAIAGAELLVRVADDGRGIPGLSDDGDLSQAPLGVGIVGMQARAARLGGRLTISSKGGGTRIVAALPATAATQDSP